MKIFSLGKTALLCVYTLTALQMAPYKQRLSNSITQILINGEVVNGKMNFCPTSGTELELLIIPLTLPTAIETEIYGDSAIPPLQLLFNVKWRINLFALGKSDVPSKS